MASAFTIVNKVSENKSLIKCRSDQVKKTRCADHGSDVFLCYTHAPSEAKVSLTENTNIQSCGGEFDGLYTFTRDGISFP